MHVHLQRCVYITYILQLRHLQNVMRNSRINSHTDKYTNSTNDWTLSLCLHICHYGVLNITDPRRLL